MNYKVLFTYVMGLGYVWIGISHFYNTTFFIKIMPPELESINQQLKELTSLENF